LLIKRGGKVGHGLFALPGGFLEPREQFYPSAVRELGEETNYRPLAFTLRAALKGQAVFDHPQRSARGRLVTTAFYFDFGGRDCPEVQAKDDAMEVGWFAIKDLAAMEDRLFEDHACILDHFLGVFGEGITHGT
jgi:bifunctional NMN adenylyltransferase/nudix hydrolase